MPRFFFDVADAPDEVGVDLPDPDSAHAYAVGFVETIVGGGVAASGADVVTIRNETGSLIEVVRHEGS